MSTSGQGRHLALRIGRNIRRARREHDWTQHQLAVLLGGKTSAQAVSDWERAAYRPSDTNLILLSQALGRDIAWFYTDHDEEAVAA